MITSSQPPTRLLPSLLLVQLLPLLSLTRLSPRLLTMAVATFGVFGTALGIVNGIIGDFSGSDSPPIVGIQIGQTVSSVDSVSSAST